VGVARKREPSNNDSKAGGNAGFFVGWSGRVPVFAGTAYKAAEAEPTSALRRPTLASPRPCPSPAASRSHHADHVAKYRRRVRAGLYAQVAAARSSHDLEPGDFVISKDRANPSSGIPLAGPFFYDYTVFVGDENFTVTEPNDMRFLDYFYQRIIAPEQEPPAPEHKRDGVISRAMRWMDQPI
jgi:hypothetical protein